MSVEPKEPKCGNCFLAACYSPGDSVPVRGKKGKVEEAEVIKKFYARSCIVTGPGRLFHRLRTGQPFKAVALPGHDRCITNRFMEK